MTTDDAAPVLLDVADRIATITLEPAERPQRPRPASCCACCRR